LIPLSAIVIVLVAPARSIAIDNRPALDPALE